MARRGVPQHSFSSGRLTAAPTARAGAPHQAPQLAASSGASLVPLGLGSQRDGLLYIPAAYSAANPAPFILTLHGAGGDSQGGLSHLIKHADACGTILLAPESRGSTWDMLRGGFGPDVEFIDRVLRQTFAQYSVDPHRCCASGFSDGASYALSLGNANGDLFTHVAAFSPGFMHAPATVGQPLIYISHGGHDRVLRIDYCSRRLVPRLQAQGYGVTYREFDGPHTVPPSIAREALHWFVRTAQQPGDGGQREL